MPLPIDLLMGNKSDRFRGGLQVSQKGFWLNKLMGFHNKNSESTLAITWIIPTDKKPFSRLDGKYKNTGGIVQYEDQKAMQNLDKISQKLCDELTKLTLRTGMSITQSNGQRLYGPPPNSGTTIPPKGSEVFVGKLPRDCMEHDIVPIFEKVGKIYEIRMMLDFSGTNRGYCFVQYHSPTEAARAVKELNKYQIRPGKVIGVSKSVDNCRLFLGGLPIHKTEADIFSEISKITEGVVRVISYSSITNRSKNRGYAFVEYESHRAAALARRKLIPGKIQMWGLDCAVDWAEPEPERNWYPQYRHPQYRHTQYRHTQYWDPQYRQPQYRQPQYWQPQYWHPQYWHPQ